MMLPLLFFLSSLLALAHSAEELKITSPPSVKAKFSYQGVQGLIQDSPALFGMPSYESARTGYLYYAIPHDGCSPFNLTAMGIDTNTYQSRIVLIDRSQDSDPNKCSFTTKVRNAGLASFQSVIIADNKVEDPLPYMADDGSGSGLTTPSILIGKADADILRSEILKVNKTYIIASITYSLPNPDNRVEWELYTSSVDPLASSFKHMFAKSVTLFKNNTLFTPHFHIVSGSDSFSEDDCTNSGRYCVSSDYLTSKPYLNGQVILQENLRQWCLYNVSLARNIDQGIWFEYVTLFDNFCSGSLDSFSSDCSLAQMNKLGISNSSIDDCVLTSGGADPDGGENIIFQGEIDALSQFSIFIFPTLNINLVSYHGSLNCPIPTDLENCAPLAAICAGFNKNYPLPLPCLTSNGCNVGEIKDDCGRCNGVGPDCRGCDGVINSKVQLDGCGICGGSGPYMGSCLSKGSIAAIFIVVFLAVFGFVGFSCFYLKRREQQMNQNVDSLLKQYLPLEGSKLIRDDKLGDPLDF